MNGRGLLDSETAHDVEYNEIKADLITEEEGEGDLVHVGRIKEVESKSIMLEGCLAMRRKHTMLNSYGLTKGFGTCRSKTKSTLD